MKRKGLSQILYLIIAASVLMMIAMVITFTATDTIGGLGSGSARKSCTQAVRGQCSAAINQDYVTMPQTCIKNGEKVVSKTFYTESCSSGSCTYSTATSISAGTTYHAKCSQW